jgi:threonine dehydrogenase-like Zn-dependent dehydrogenase
MTEPCAVALHSLEHAELHVGASVCIIGAGPIGVMLGKWSLLKGASKVCLIDIDENKIAFARKLGFETEMNGKYDMKAPGRVQGMKAPSRQPKHSVPLC